MIEAQKEFQETLLRAERYARPFAVKNEFWCWLKMRDDLAYEAIYLHRRKRLSPILDATRFVQHQSSP